MKTISMSGSLRENVGKKEARQQRRQGNVPCVLYGGEKQVHFSTDEKSFNRILFTPEVFIIKLDIGDMTYDTILQDIQYHPVTDQVMHADFLELLPGHPVTVALPVRFEGTAAGILQGGKLIRKKRKLRVKGLVEHLPDDIVLDVTDMNIGDSIRIGDIHLENLELLDTSRDVVVTVRVTRAAVAPAGTEGGEETPAATPEGTPGTATPPAK
jgi:large subunit ribosomal protein L25